MKFLESICAIEIEFMYGLKRKMNYRYREVSE